MKNVLKALQVVEVRSDHQWEEWHDEACLDDIGKEEWRRKSHKLSTGMRQDFVLLSVLRKVAYLNAVSVCEHPS